MIKLVMDLFVVPPASPSAWMMLQTKRGQLTRDQLYSERPLRNCIAIAKVENLGYLPLGLEPQHLKLSLKKTLVSRRKVGREPGWCDEPQMD